MAPKSVTFRRHDHLVSVLFGDLLSHSYNITFSMFLYLVHVLLEFELECLSSVSVGNIALAVVASAWFRVLPRVYEPEYGGILP